MTIRVVTDTAADLPESVRVEFGISVVPLTIRFGEEEFLDQATLTTDAFWDRVRTATQLPETAAPSVGQFESVFKGLRDEGATGIICVSLSGNLSATMQSAVLAAKSFDDGFPIRVVDSTNVSLGQAMLVRRCAELIQLGHDIDSVCGDLERARERTELFGLLDTLEFLHKGGRIGGAKKLLGSMLSIKPIIKTENGAVNEAGKVRTRAKGIAFLLEQLEGKALDSVGVLHGQASDVDELVARVTEATGLTPMVNCLGPVVGTHTGPGSIGVTFIASE